MQAVRATFFGLPAASNRWQKGRNTEFQRLATRVSPCVATPSMTG